MLRLAAVCVLAVAAACGRDAKVYNIPSCAMAPTLQSGGKVAVTSSTEPGRGDVVVFRVRGEERVSRVVAVGGDRVESKDGRVLINGAAVDEPFLAPGMTTPAFGPVDVPAGSVFVMGDNRTNSADSRVFGPLPADDVVGTAKRLKRGDGC